MKLTLTYMITIVTLIITMLAILMMSKKSISNFNKSTPFECGFNPMSKKRTPFSIQFFMIAIIFLIFDIEIIILLPSIITMKFSMIKYWMATMCSFTTILIMGLYYEWYNGLLEWKN